MGACPYAGDLVQIFWSVCFLEFVLIRDLIHPKKKSSSSSSSFFFFFFFSKVINVDERNDFSKVHLSF
jgi:hypothetical protein